MKDNIPYKIYLSEAETAETMVQCPGGHEKQARAAA